MAHLGCSLSNRDQELQPQFVNDPRDPEEHPADLRPFAPLATRDRGLETPACPPERHSWRRDAKRNLSLPIGLPQRPRPDEALHERRHGTAVQRNSAPKHVATRMVAANNGRPCLHRYAGMAIQSGPKMAAMGVREAFAAFGRRLGDVREASGRPPGVVRETSNVSHVARSAASGVVNACNKKASRS